jgi:tol-pal system beta propeller repeat protein TolB
MAAAALAAGVLLAVVGPKPASAALPGQNGKIVFAGTPDVIQQPNNSIYTINPDGTDDTRLTDDTINAEFPSFSPNGQKIAFDIVGTGFCPQIYVMDADGSNQTSALTSQGCNFQPSWGPDNKIVFTSTRDRNDEIYVMDSDGSNQTNLSNNPGVDEEPNFSPDGSEIAFATDRDGNFQVYKMNASDGSDQTNLSNDPRSTDEDPNFSPDGGKIVFTRDKGKPAIYVMRSTDGSKQERLTRSRYHDEQPAFSPDGKRITFVRDSMIIYKMHSDGSKKQILFKGGEASTSNDPDWGVATGA